MRPSVTLLRGLGLLLLVVGLVGSLSVSATAQDDGGPAEDSFSVFAGVLRCDGPTEPRLVLSQCETTPGVDVTIVDPASGSTATCTTNDIGGCSVPAPFGAETVLTVDPTTVPEGYVAQDEGTPYSVPDSQAEAGGAIFSVQIALIPVSAGMEEPGSDASQEPSEAPSIPEGYVHTYLCDTDPGPRAPATDQPFPSDCETVEGVQVVASLEDGTMLDSCTTVAGACDFQNLPSCPENALVFTEDLTTLPPGYAPRENPIRDLNCTEFRGVSFYNVATDAPASSPPEEATGTLTAETDGSNVAIYAGDCDGDFTDEPIATLTNVRPPDGDPAGADTASAVETSFTSLDLPLDDLLADDHVLVVFDQDDDSVPLACGAIGGIVTADGSLTVGLSAVGESRYAGVAVLTEAGEQTQATIFLAEDLSAEVTPTT